MHSLMILSSTLLLFGLVMMNNGSPVYDGIAPTTSLPPDGWDSYEPEISNIHDADNTKDRFRSNLPPADKRQSTTVKYGCYDGDRECICGNFIYDSVTHGCHNGKVVARNEIDQDQEADDQTTFSVIDVTTDVSDQAAHTAEDIAGKQNSIPSSNDNQTQNNAQQGVDFRAKIISHMLARFADPIAEAMEAIVSQVDNEKNKVSAITINQTNNHSQPTKKDCHRKSNNEQAASSEYDTSTTRRCVTNENGIKLCQCGLMGQLYDVKNYFCQDGQVIDQLNNEDNSSASDIDD